MYLFKVYFKDHMRREKKIVVNAQSKNEAFSKIGEYVNERTEEFGRSNVNHYILGFEFIEEIDLIK